MTGNEIEVSAELVRALLREQHPDLAGLAIREVVGGWGNQMWRLGDELVVRMQRMDPTPEHQLKERRWLPVLAPRLPLPVPRPVRFGAPSERFPKHWTVMTWVPGEPLDHASINRGADAADTLAGFLRALHVAAPAEAPTAKDRGAHPRIYTSGFENFLRAVALDGIAADVRDVWADATAAPAWTGPPVWVHGDLHPANVVVSNGTISGIVDFGDMFAGDPAWDLAAAWVLLPAGTAPPLLRHLRARGRISNPARPRTGRNEEPLPDPHGTERRSRPPRRQTTLGPRRPGSPRTRSAGIAETARLIPTYWDHRGAERHHSTCSFSRSGGASE
ncbi:phosphotransferase [Nocardia brasiliensis]|uniref:phosphotransferase n=1 Tax=Nocardia brasiliensis TaxID=37326 RepID=UPI002454324E|nr:phosphotransferase [Nocardia brasiliensis]